MDIIITIIGQLFQSYGLAGLAISSILVMLWRVNQKAEKALKRSHARVLELEKHQDEMYMEQIELHKTMIKEYVELVQGKVRVLTELTSCINTMNDTLKRIEFRQEIRKQD